MAANLGSASLNQRREIIKVNLFQNQNGNILLIYKVASARVEKVKSGSYATKSTFLNNQCNHVLNYLNLICSILLQIINNSV